jgi:hypothetical protein
MAARQRPAPTAAITGATAPAPPDAGTPDPAGEAAAPSPQPDLPGRTPEIPPPPAAALLDPDILATHPDANLTPPFQPLRVEALPAGARGPRLALQGLNEVWTVNLGRVAAGQPASRTLAIHNVGTERLVVPRIHDNCGCLTVRVDGAAPAADGYLPLPLEVAPGAAADLAIVFDPSVPRAYIPDVASAWFLQIFSNDPHYERFMPDDAASHETRVRIVSLVPGGTPTPDRPET